MIIVIIRRHQPTAGARQKEGTRDGARNYKARKRLRKKRQIPWVWASSAPKTLVFMVFFVPRVQKLQKHGQYDAFRALSSLHKLLAVVKRNGMLKVL
jgi:hypothetical protein